jgi:hypothetical protein
MRSSTAGRRVEEGGGGSGRLWAVMAKAYGLLYTCSTLDVGDGVAVRATRQGGQGARVGGGRGLGRVPVRALSVSAAGK